MKRIIYLITIFKTNNIGAVLQAYALVNVLEKYGKVFLVDIDNYHINKGVRLIRFGLTFKSILSVGKDILRLFSRKLLIKKFKSFIKKVDLININEIVENPSCYFFTGSDQFGILIVFQIMERSMNDIFSIISNLIIYFHMPLVKVLTNFLWNKNHISSTY